MAVPTEPKIYHIVHMDRIASIISEGFLWCDAKMVQCPRFGTTIGMKEIKERRLEISLESHSGLHVGDCVPFYFCPRSIMLYVISQKNHPGLNYRGGQESIIHLEADLNQTVGWANDNRKRWAFTLSNAGAVYFEYRCSLAELNEINWDAVNAQVWSNHEIKEGKQAEFLIEGQFPWELVSRIGVQSRCAHQELASILGESSHKPRLEIKEDWYY